MKIFQVRIKLKCNIFTSSNNTSKYIVQKKPKKYLEKTILFDKVSIVAEVQGLHIDFKVVSSVTKTHFLFVKKFKLNINS